MAWFGTITQLLIRLSASFWRCGMKMLHGIWYKLEEWIRRYLIQTYHRLTQEYFKSYRIALRVALWLDFEQLFSYLFISRCLFYELRYQNVTWNLIQNWRIESKDILFKLTRGYLKSISSHIEKLLGWLYGFFLNNYPVTYSFIGVFFELRYQNVTWNLIQIGGLNQEMSYSNLLEVIFRYFRSYRIAFRVALWLDFKQLSSYLFVYRRLFGVAVGKYYMEFDTNWRIESRDILSKLTRSYLKSISSHIE